MIVFPAPASSARRNELGQLEQVVVDGLELDGGAGRRERWRAEVRSNS